MTVGHARLSGVICAAPDPARLIGVWEALGATATVPGDGRLLVDVDGSAIEYLPDNSGRSGIGGVLVQLTLRVEH